MIRTLALEARACLAISVAVKKGFAAVVTAPRCKAARKEKTNSGKLGRTNSHLIQT